MASENSEVLSLSDNDFSGFSSDEIPKKQKGTVKSTVTKAAPKEKVQEKSTKNVSKNKSGKNQKTYSRPKPKDKSKTNQKPESEKDNNSNLDLSNMSKSEIDNLKELLGLGSQLADQNNGQCSSQAQPQDDNSSRNDDDDDDLLGHRPCLNDLPNMRINFNPRDLSDDEFDYENANRRRLNMNEALYDDFDDENWDLPQPKTPARGRPISTSLAKMLNVACTSQCETETLMSKYYLPENCEKAGAPLVNMEIWQALNKPAQVQDRSLVKIQNLVAGSMIPILKLAEILKPQISSNAEAKILLGDALTLLGQTQFSLSVRRRYFIKPNLKKKYFPLCKISQPITDKLFGDEISKEIKACDSVTALGKYDGFNSRFRGGGKFSRRGAYRDYSRSGQQYGNYQGNTGYNEQRYQPYPQRGGYRDRGGFRQNRRRWSASTATLPPAPNDKQ